MKMGLSTEDMVAPHYGDMVLLCLSVYLLFGCSCVEYVMGSDMKDWFYTSTWVTTNQSDFVVGSTDTRGTFVVGLKLS